LPGRLDSVRADFHKPLRRIVIRPYDVVAMASFETLMAGWGKAPPGLGADVEYLPPTTWLFDLFLGLLGRGRCGLLRRRS